MQLRFTSIKAGLVKCSQLFDELWFRRVGLLFEHI